MNLLRLLLVSFLPLKKQEGSLSNMDFRYSGIGRRMIIRTKVKLRIEITILFFSISVLIFVYRLGSARVDRGFEPGMRDIGTYLRAGTSFLDGRDPYIDPAVRFGPSLFPFFGLLDLTVSDWIVALLFQLISIIGILYFVTKITDLSPLSNLTLLIVLCWLSSVRENLVNIQVTGFLSLLFALGYQLFKTSPRITCRLIGIYFLAVSIDTKPHLFGVLFLALFVYEKRYKAIPIVFLTILFSHVILSILVDKNLTLSWLQTLMHLYDERKSGNLGENLVVWPIFEHFGLDERVASVSSIFVFAVLLSILIFRIKEKNLTRNQVIELSLLIPSFGIFFHYYDFAPLISILLINLSTENRTRQALMLLPIVLIPGNASELQSIFVVFSILLFLFLFDSRYANISLRYWLTSIGIWILYSVLVNYFSNFELKQQAQVTAVAIWLLILGFRGSFKKRRIGEPS